MMRVLVILALLLMGGILTAAQSDTPRPVTYDDINGVASRMFCPECENIPLDKCFTTVCVQWKQDIAEQLAAGASADEIIAGFVARFGDQVVGVPQDPFLRNLALIAPTLFLVLAGVIGVYAIRSRLNRNLTSDATDIPVSSTLDKHYLDQLKRDVDRD